MKKGAAIAVVVIVLVLEGLFFIKVRNDKPEITEPSKAPQIPSVAAEAETEKVNTGYCG